MVTSARSPSVAGGGGTEAPGAAPARRAPIETASATRTVAGKARPPNAGSAATIPTARKEPIAASRTGSQEFMRSKTGRGARR